MVVVALLRNQKMVPALSLASVKDLMLSPNQADDDPGLPMLAVDLGTGDAISEADCRNIGRWLEELPLPVIGIGTAAQSPPSGGQAIIDAMDLVIAEDNDYAMAQDAIKRNPMAASVLVQVLRTVEHLPVSMALGVESLAYATLQGGAEFKRWLETSPPRRSHQHDTDTPPVLLDRSDNRLTITLNSPANRNALSVTMRDSLTEAFKLVAMDSTIDGVDVRANGPSFSAGGDLTEFGTADDLSMAHRIRSLRMPARYLAPHAARYTFHLHGACIGAGIELPAFAGRLVASRDTVLRLPEVAMGLIPGAGGCVSISRRIGRQRTAWMAITGKAIDVEEALQWGLIDAVET